MEKEVKRKKKRKMKEGKANALHKLKTFFTFSFSLFLVETFEGMKMRKRISSIRTEERKSREKEEKTRVI